MQTKDGKSCTLIKLTNSELRDSTKNSDSISTDHSTSDPECQCKELQNVLVQTMLFLRDGERMLLLNNGISMKSQRLSRTTTGSHIHLIFNPTVTLLTSDALQPTQDGGRCSDTRKFMLPMREEKFWMLLETSIRKTETSEYTRRTME
jgi:hypothetical protein